MNCTIIEHKEQNKKETDTIIEETDKKRKIILKYKPKSKKIYPRRYDYIDGRKVYNYDKDCSPIYTYYTILNHNEKELIYISFENVIKDYRKERYEQFLEVVNLMKLKGEQKGESVENDN